MKSKSLVLLSAFVLVFAAFSVSFSQTCTGTAGCLDPTFGGGDGTVAYSNPLVGAVPRDLAVQSDGKLISLTGPTGGQDSTYSLIRINTDGTLDTSFNGTGTRSFQWGLTSKTSFYFGYARAIGIQNINGIERIVVAGQSPKLSGKSVQNFLRVDRFMPDGTLDTSFGTGGSVYLSVGQAYDIEIQPDQKIVGVTEGPTGKVFRLNANGTLDSTFGSAGVAAGDGYLQKLTLDSDGSILVASNVQVGRGNNNYYNIEVRKYRPNNGSLDSSFGTGGAAKFARLNYSFVPKDITVDSLHNILITTRAWTPNQDFAAVRFTQSGLVDTSFASSGLYLAGLSAMDARLSAGAMESDGKIVLIGDFNGSTAPKDAVVIRLNYDGSADPTFGSGGISIFDIAGLDYVSIGRGGVIQMDPSCTCQKILVASGNDHLTTFARVTTQ